MNMTTFSPRISPQTKRSIKNYWKGLLTTKMTFPARTSPKASPQTKNSIKNYWKGLLAVKMTFPARTSQKASPQTKNSVKNYWKGLLAVKMTFPARTSQKASPQTQKSATEYGKVGLYIANFVFALFLIRYGKLFSDTFTVPSSIFVIGVFLYAGLNRLRRLGDGTRVNAYIEDHEAWVLILIAISLIAGTMFYAAFQA
jgi:hypothetical protein